MLLLFLGTATSCRPKYRGVHYSPMQVAGTSKITLVVESLPFDPRTAPNPFYLELMTAKDTFLVRPAAEELSFPTLTDSLTQVNLYYNDWYCQVRGRSVRDAYGALYFPNKAATIIIDTHPFGYPGAKRVAGRLYCQIRVPQAHQWLTTTLTQAKRTVK